MYIWKKLVISAQFCSYMLVLVVITELCYERVQAPLGPEIVATDLTGVYRIGINRTTTITDRFNQISKI